MDEHFEFPPAKRQKVSAARGLRRISRALAPSAVSPVSRVTVDDMSPSSSKGNDMNGDEGPKSRQHSESLEPGLSAASFGPLKPKRVRTGCLTCRNRHLKCDEAMPVCVNCQKSNRKCERGVRLNFIDLKVEQPPYLLPPVDWQVKFQDESRHIASEYVGGLERYAKLGQQVVTPPREPDVSQPDARPVPRLEAVQAEPDQPAATLLCHPQAALNLYYSGGMARSHHEPAYSGGYEETMGQTFSRKDSEVLLTMGSGPTPTSSHSGGGGRGPSFNLETAHDPFSMRDDGVLPRHGYTTSDVSSEASSLVPQRVTAVSSPGPFRHATASGGPDPHDGLMTPQSEKNGERDYLSSPEEVHYMEVFINEVAVWMDSFDGRQHFGTVIPYLALKSPMLLGAFLACGVKHLTLIDRRSYKDDKALHYYDTATTQLLRSLQNPERDTAECATTAVVLNVYEIMSEKPAVRMNHIAGARALIRECKWDARSTGIGAACFWLNVGMEILSCLACNWATAWDPDHWGVDPEELMNMTGELLGPRVKTPKSESGGMSSSSTAAAEESLPWSASSIAGVVGDEDVWVHRIMYIVAKVANFRASIPPLQEPSAHDEQVRLQSRFAEWSQLKTWCDTWNIHCPSSMRPYAYLFDSGKRSCFPHIWLIKRSALVGRLFYHTAMCLLAQINPLLAIRDDDEEARKVQLHHAHQVCGIAAHTQDHGVASIAIRALAIAGSVLTERHEQHEVLEILTHIYRKTGWNLKRVQFDLKCAWGWESGGAFSAGGGSSCAGPASLGAGGLLRQHHAAQQPSMSPSAQDGRHSAAAAIGQFFGRRDQHMPQVLHDPQRASQQQQPPPTGPPPTPSHLSTPVSETRRGTLIAGPTPSFPAAAARNNSIATASPSTQTSPAATTTYTPASVSSTPPSARPTVNPLLAQADFTQPNHPYREWYKPPERAEKSERSGGHGHRNSFSSAAMWTY